VAVIGLFDSGLGGLTVLARLRERLPDADVIFFADQMHVPYGDRTHADLLRLLRANLARFDEYGVDAIVMACNTSCAIAERYGWPSSRAPVLDLIDSAAIAVERGGFRRLGVVATAATVGAGSYGRTLRARIAGIDVVEVPAPALVPLVETGMTAGDEPRAAVAEVCTHLPLDLDALVFGCTHYPVLATHFEALLGSETALIDPAIVQAERAAELLADRANGSGRTTYITSGDEAAFRANVSRMMRTSPLLRAAASGSQERYNVPGIVDPDKNQ
jgi:glutamate racemase